MRLSLARSLVNWATKFGPITLERCKTSYKATLVNSPPGSGFKQRFQQKAQQGPRADCQRSELEHTWTFYIAHQNYPNHELQQLQQPLQRPSPSVFCLVTKKICSLTKIIPLYQTYQTICLLLGTVLRKLSIKKRSRVVGVQTFDGVVLVAHGSKKLNWGSRTCPCALSLPPQEALNLISGPVEPGTGQPKFEQEGATSSKNSLVSGVSVGQCGSWPCWVVLLSFYFGWTLDVRRALRICSWFAAGKVHNEFIQACSALLFTEVLICGQKAQRTFRWKQSCVSARKILVKWRKICAKMLPWLLATSFGEWQLLTCFAWSLECTGTEILCEQIIIFFA